MTTSAWRLILQVPEAALALFERALARLGGALVSGGRDREGRVPLSVYLAAAPSRAEVTTLLAAAAAAAGTAVPGFGLEALPAVDWVAESEKALPPIRAGRFYVYGGHVKAPAPAAFIAIRIEASVAFGTGRHESTRGCLLLLDRLARRRRFLRPLDMGCGSGILAIAMARLWPAPVLAADIDPDSVAKARDNALVNGVASRVRVLLSDGYRGRQIVRRGPYDLVVANILAGPLAAMAPELRAALAPGGRAVLSGLLAAQERQVLAAHRGLGLVLEQRLRLGDWTSLLLRG